MIVAKNLGKSASIPLDLINNKNLSIGARMLCIYLISKPLNWKVYISNISDVLGISRNTAYKYLKELIDANLLEKTNQEIDGEDECIYIFDLDGLKSLVPKNEHYNIYIDSKKKKNKQKKKKQVYHLKVSDIYLALEIGARKKALIQKPDGLDTKELEAFYKFLDYRRERGHLPQSTISHIAKRFEKLKAMGENISDCVNRSIEYGWRGIFGNTKNTNKMIDKSAHDEIFDAIIEKYQFFTLEEIKERIKEIIIDGKKVQLINGVLGYENTQ